MAGSLSLLPGAFVTGPEAYGARKACGCLVAAVVNEIAYPEQIADSIARLIRKGYSIEPKTIREIKAELTSCRCGPEQTSLAISMHHSKQVPA